MKKNYPLLAACLLCMFAGYAQSIAINTDGSLPDNNAILDIKSNNKGILIPRLSSKARLNIPPARGLLVYDTTTNSFWYHTGAKWQTLATGNSIAATLSAIDPWLLEGNSGTADSVNFLGTTDMVPMNFRVNNQRSGRIDPAYYNTFLGYQSGVTNTTGSSNTGTGSYSLYSNTYGSTNSAIGTYALYTNTTGSANVANGYRALYTNSSGGLNTAMGTGSMYFNATGSKITAYGAYASNSIKYANISTATGIAALYSNNSGIDNTATGDSALFSNTTGSGNTANGTHALFSNTTGNWNSAFGAYALFSNTTGYDNTALGNHTLYSNTTGYRNTAIGKYSMFSNTTGYDNTVTGDTSLVFNTTGNGNTAYGDHVLVDANASYNTAFGGYTMRSTTTGSENTSVGYANLYANTTGSKNVALGHRVLFSNINGNNNTAVGEFSISFNVDGSNNTATGQSTLWYYNYRNNNTATGYKALFDVNGNDNNGSNNTATGAFCFQEALDYNTAIGTPKHSNYSVNSNNTFVAETYPFGPVWAQTGANNTVLGRETFIIGYHFSNATAIGYGAEVDTSNKVRIGNSSVTVIEGAVPFTVPSDSRFKYNVQEDVKGLDFILQLRPVTYRFNANKPDAGKKPGSRKKITACNPVMQASYTEAAQIRRSGFIAQEVEKAALATGYDFNGIHKPRAANDHYSLSYESFVVPLVKAVQQRQQLINHQKKQLQQQDKAIADLQQQILELKKAAQQL